FSYEAGHITFAVRCLKKDTAQVISLLAEQLSRPGFPSDEFEKMRKEKIAEAHELRDNTDAQAAIAFRRAIYPATHPQYELSAEERLAVLPKVAVADVKAFYAETGGPDFCTMVVVGDIEPGSIRQ